MSGEIEKPCIKDTLLIGDCLVNLKNYKRLDFNSSKDNDVNFTYCFCGSQGSYIEAKETVKRGISKAKFHGYEDYDKIEDVLKSVIKKYSISNDARISVIAEDNQLYIEIEANKMSLNLTENLDG